jgi:hypothetical protein
MTVSDKHSSLFCLTVIDKEEKFSTMTSARAALTAAAPSFDVIKQFFLIS